LPHRESLWTAKGLPEWDSTSEHLPGERLVVCRNPLLAEARAQAIQAVVRPG
jgi:hypothetical protein